MVRFCLVRLAVAAALLGGPAGAMAADMITPAPGPVFAGQCYVSQGSHLLDLPAADLRGEVEQRLAHAVDTAERADVIYSTRPGHTWAFETRYACGKALGYLKTSTVEPVEIAKCDCFYQRMVRFID